MAARFARTTEESAELAQRFYKNAHALRLEKLTAKLREMLQRAE